MKQYYIKVTRTDKTEFTDLKTAKDVIKSFNNLYSVWDTLKEFNYLSIEIYKLGCTLPKRILI